MSNINTDISSNTVTDISSVIFNIIKNIPPITYISCQQVNDSSYDVIEIENVLTKEECNELIDIAFKIGLNDYSIRDVSNNLKNDNLSCYYKHCHVYIDFPSEIPIKLRRLCEQYTCISINNQEKIDIINYNVGNYFDNHHDAFDKVRKLATGFVNQRKYTFMVYLNEEFEGGTTEFPLINKIIIPKTGKAVVFKDSDSSNNIISQSMHRGNIVTNGTKWICNIFSY